jgi:predicted RNA-binding Zn-ribbon protein involved in translation (DUF1610 family)
MDFQTIAGALASLKTSTDMVRAVVATNAQVKGDQRVVDALRELSNSYELLLSLQGELIRLSGDNLELRRRLQEQDDWTARASTFALFKAPGGAVVYRSDGPPEHYACPACFEQKKIHRLQDRRVMAGTYECPNSACKQHYLIDPRKSYPVQPTSPGRGFRF